MASQRLLTFYHHLLSTIFLTLLSQLQPTFSATSKSTDPPICRLHRSGGWVRGLYTQNDHLKLIFDENLYELPLSTSYVDSAKGRLRMFGSEMLNHSQWYKDKDGVGLFRDLIIDQKQPIQMAYLKGASSLDPKGYLLAVMGNADRSKMHHYLVRLPDGQHRVTSLVYLGAAVAKYVVLGPSTDEDPYRGFILLMGASWLLRDAILVDCELKVLNQNDLDLLLPPVPFDPAAGRVKGVKLSQVQPPAATYYSIKLSDKGLTLTKIDSPPPPTGEKERPVKSSKLFGFLSGTYVHLWDMRRKVVAIAELMPPRPGHLIPVKYVPMDDYFACNTGDWQREAVTVGADVDGVSEDTSLDATDGVTGAFLSQPTVLGIMGVILAAFLLLGVLTWVITRGGRRPKGGGGGGGARRSWFSDTAFSVHNGPSVSQTDPRTDYRRDGGGGDAFHRPLPPRRPLYRR